MARLPALMATLVAATFLTGCGDKPPTPGPETGDASADAALPGPEAAGNASVTGMPDEPGPRQPGPLPPLELPPDTPVASDGNLVPLPPGTDAGADGQAVPGFAGTGEVSPPTASEPGAQAAVAVVRAYYDAIAQGRYDQAYALWSDNGRASGQSPQQFAGGFADTASLSVEVLTPGRVEPAAGSRYVEVPIALTATHRDGSRHKFVGAYTLRRSVVDGASDEQRAWRLYQADIREVQL